MELPLLSNPESTKNLAKLQTHSRRLTNYPNQGKSQKIYDVNDVRMTPRKTVDAKKNLLEFTDESVNKSRKKSEQRNKPSTARHSNHMRTL